MENQFTNLKLTKVNLESYVIRAEILKAVIDVIPLFQGKILDSGCGCMPYKELILSNKKISKYIGLDIDTGLNYYEVKPDVLWNGITMPFESNCFDVVMSTEVLEHILNPDAYLREVKRVLKPDGFFFFTVPFLMSLHEVPNDYYRYTPYSLEMIFKRVGFSDIKIKAISGDKKVEKITYSNNTDDKDVDLSVDGVFIEIGRIAHTDLVSEFVERDEKMQLLVNNKMETKTEGLFAAGDVTNISEFKQITVATGQATIAALSAYQYLQSKGSDLNSKVYY